MQIGNHRPPAAEGRRADRKTYWSPHRRLLAVSRPVGGILSTGPFPGSGWVAIHLCGLPGDMGRAGRPTLDLAPGGVCRAARVTPGAGALLPHRFTLACDGGAVHRRSVLCGTFLRVTSTGCWPAPCPAESRPSSTGSMPGRDHPAGSPLPTVAAGRPVSPLRRAERSHVPPGRRGCLAVSQECFAA